MHSVRRSRSAPVARRLAAALALAAAPLLTAPAGAGDGPPIEIRPAAGEITVDGRLDDPAWRQAARVTRWFETSPADNQEAPVANVAYLAYDEAFFYAGFELADPEPAKTRAPLAERDNVPASTDYAGLLIDASNDGRTAQMFLANPRGVQYDAITSDASGEDSSPDFFWDAAARVTDDGWVLEMRIPFSSLRYREADPEAWGVLLYRNWPRDFRYQMYSAKLPRDRGCFVCNANRLTGLSGLPASGGLVVAPYVTAGERSRAVGAAGSRLASDGLSAEPGVDVKWIPSPDLVIDGTVNPDFSQIEADAPRIAANERFALFFPEKRPFFLEGVDLFSTPIQAVYTRSFTSPRWGARATGGGDSLTYTALVGQDRGGGSVIVPGPQGSSLAPRDFDSTVAIGRLRRDFGQSFLSFLVSDREGDGGSYNRVLGPDFRWRPTEEDTVSGQLLWSETRTPERPDLAAEWDGRSLSDHAARLWWYHSDGEVDWFVQGLDFGDAFRADNGFVPQVGFRQLFGDTGYTFRRDEGPVHRLRLFVFGGHTEDRRGRLLSRQISPGFGLSGKWSSFVRMNVAFDEVRAGEELFARSRYFYTVEASPTQAVSELRVSGFVGDDVDFAHGRPGEGGRVAVGATLRPLDRLELRLDGERRWLDVEPEGGPGGRLFTAHTGRLRATYNFTARIYLRLLGQWTETERAPELFDGEVEPRSAGLSGSALFAYKLDWQTVLFLGVGEDRTLADRPVGADGLAGADGRSYEPTGRELFLKVSYAFQR